MNDDYFTAEASRSLQVVCPERAEEVLAELEDAFRTGQLAPGTRSDLGRSLQATFPDRAAQLNRWLVVRLRHGRESGQRAERVRELARAIRAKQDDLARKTKAVTR